MKDTYTYGWREGGREVLTSEMVVWKNGTCFSSSREEAHILWMIVIQVLLDEYKEAQQQILGALKVRRKYMELSMQEFYSTTGKMLDDELPPSSHFCVQGNTQGKLLYTSAGDVVSTGECSLYVGHSSAGDVVSTGGDYSTAVLCGLYW